LTPTLFDAHVARAIGSSTDDSRRMLPVIEKEVLHHDILRALHEGGFLARLVFFGGTNLRLCHGASRYSEDLDFKGGPGFTESMLEGISDCLAKAFRRRYGLESRVSQPSQAEGNTRTWSILIVTRPGTRSERQQKVHLDVCRLTSHEHAPRILANHYAVDLGTAGLLIRSQSLRESYTDKLLAVALRKRLLPRDLWDIAWIRQNPANTIPLAFEEKLAEHGSDRATFIDRAACRADEVMTKAFRASFEEELERFLTDRLIPTIRDPEFLTYIAQSIREDAERFVHAAERGRESRWEL
jgi:predicted nucleotidyltransferase component of viral defense system